ncbi:MAG: hypothetical protein LRZ84_22295 [Desertifilum sp.]|nr:hypothetical protein [Desertifilum sp.]
MQIAARGADIDFALKVGHGVGDAVVAIAKAVFGNSGKILSSQARRGF